MCIPTECNLGDLYVAELVGENSSVNVRSFLIWVLQIILHLFIIVHFPKLCPQWMEFQDDNWTGIVTTKIHD